MTSTFDPATLPTKRVGAGVLLRNAAADVLLVKPTYKHGWEIPGGLVEPGESPREGARRECREELGIDPELGMPVCVHYATGRARQVTASCSSSTAAPPVIPADAFRLPPDELESARLVAPEALAEHLEPIMVTRMLAAIDGATAGTTIYLER